MKIGCLIYFFGHNWEEMGKCAVNSFKKWHPDIDMYHIGKHNIREYDAHRFFKKIPHGPLKFLLAYEVMRKGNYDKMIVLGADTITCGRLTEFIEDNEHDVISSLDYPYHLDTPRIKTPKDHWPDSDEPVHLNADVNCFNNPDVLKEIMKVYKHHKIYLDQGALNEIVWSGNYNFKCRVVDGPYEESTIAYNVRAKGNLCQPEGQPAPWKPYTSKFYVKDEKLFTSDNKQIKVWHYCEGFGAAAKKTTIMEIMNNWIFNWFNEETKAFFKEQCACGDFFEKRFTL